MQNNIDVEDIFIRDLDKNGIWFEERVSSFINIDT